MKKYINTSNYYLSTITSKIEASWNTGTFDVLDVTVDWVMLPQKWYYWVDVDFGDVSIREIFRITKREWYTLFYDKRISPYGLKTHSIWATVALRDFSQLLNSLSTNTDNFWEIEETGSLSILVRWGKVYKSWTAKANEWIKTIADTTFSLDANTVTYIVLSFDEIAFAFNKVTNTELLTNDWQYPIAKITTGSTGISDITDLRCTVVWWWDMRKALYDPDWLETDVFDMNNMKQWDATHKYVWQADITKWDWYEEWKQNTLVSWENLATINNQDLLKWWNIAIDTILTAWWALEEINQQNLSWNWGDVYEYTFQTAPLSPTAFIIMNNSGQILVWWEWWDYTYDEDIHTVTFPSWIPSTETYRAWIMYDDKEWENIQYTTFLTQQQYNNLPADQKNKWDVFIIYE